jgi:hypothetical protein
LIHLAEIDADAAVDGLHLAFERGAGAKRDHRCCAGGTEFHDRGNFVVVLHKTNRVGRLYRMPGFAVSMLLQYRGAGADAFTQQLAQLFDQGCPHGNFSYRLVHARSPPGSQFRVNYATSSGYYHGYLRYPASMDKARIGYILRFNRKGIQQ